MKIVEERDPQSYAIIGAAMVIHRQLGHWLLKAIYQEAAVIEFRIKQIPFEREVPLPVGYKTIFSPRIILQILFIIVISASSADKIKVII